MVGHWPLDSTELQTPALTTTVTPPPESNFESDLNVTLWNLAQPKDFAFIFTPRGKLVTNGLPHFDGAYHILVSHGGQSTAAAAPGTSGLPAATSPTLFTPTNDEIYVMNADGPGPQTRLTTNSSGDWSPKWSPDGSRIAFFSARDGNSQIYVMNADGSGQTNLSDGSTSDNSPSTR
jgi:hypothetical protein